MRRLVSIKVLDFKLDMEWFGWKRDVLLTCEVEHGDHYHRPQASLKKVEIWHDGDQEYKDMTGWFRDPRLIQSLELLCEDAIESEAPQVREYENEGEFVGGRLS